MSRVDEENQNKKDGRLVLGLLVGFFLTFAAVDAFFVYQALSTHRGVVTQHAYEQGLHYNKIIAEAKKRQHEHKPAQN